MAPENRVSAYQQETQHSASEMASQMYRQAGDMVKENPGTSALVTFGLGLGLGLTITALLAEPDRKRASSWYQSYMPENFSKQVADAVSRMLPDALSRHIG